jgi:hypothetical protein
MDEQQKIIQNFFREMRVKNGISIENIDSKNVLCCYRWQLTTDKENSIWELKQLPRHIVLKTLSLRFESFTSEKLLPLLNMMNHYNQRGTFSLGMKGDVYLENSYFYRTNFYIEEELALFISELIDHLSFFYLVGENYLINNLEMEDALQTSIQLLQEKKN